MIVKPLIVTPPLTTLFALATGTVPTSAFTRTLAHLRDEVFDYLIQRFTSLAFAGRPF